MPADVVTHTDVATWVQAVLQGGALTIVVFLIRWTTKQIPKWLQAARDERELLSAAAREERTAATKERQDRDVLMQNIITMLQDKFDERTREVTAAIRAQTRDLTNSLKEQTTGFSRGLEGSASRIESAVNRVCKAEQVHRSDPRTQLRPSKDDNSGPIP